MLNNQLLLGAHEPAPVKWHNRHCASPVLLICEHAGQHVPQRLDNLGLPAEELNKHIGWDIGASALAMQISDILQAPLVSQRYSRLVIDCNRPPDTPGSVPSISDGVIVPANQHATAAEIAARQAEIFIPFNAAIEDAFSLHPRTAAFSIHSFTPTMDGVARPWHAGFLSRGDLDTANRLINQIANRNGDLTLAINQPYQIDDETDWFIPQHAEAREIMHTLIEVRNDQLCSTQGIEYWADLISSAIVHVLQEENR